MGFRMKKIILIGFLLSAITVQPKSIQQKAAGNAEQPSKQFDQGPATFESRDENVEEQVQKLQKMLQMRQELVRVEREAADPESDTSRQDWSPSDAWKSVKNTVKKGWNGAKNLAKTGWNGFKNVAKKGLNALKDIKSKLENYLNSEEGLPLKNCMKQAGEDAVESMVNTLKKVAMEKLSSLGKRSKDQEIQLSQAEEKEQELLKKAMEELMQMEREEASSIRQDGWFGDVKDMASGKLMAMKQCVADHADFDAIKNLILEYISNKGEVPEEENPE